MDDLKVTFGEFEAKNVIKPLELIPANVAQDKLTIFWPSKINKYYTLIMYDLDTERGILTHYLVFNILDLKLDQADTVLDYIPPEPTNGPHHYVIRIYEQTKLLKIKTKVTRLNAYDKVIAKFDQTKYELVFLVTPANYQQVKYCHCTLKVGAENTTYNPFAVCAKSTKTTYKKCEENVYEPELGVTTAELQPELGQVMAPLNYLQRYAKIHQLPIKPSAKSQLDVITTWLNRA